MKANSKPALKLTHLQKRFGEFVALADINFAVQPGEVYGLLGPNGAGKTTTLRIVTGLLMPSAGTVEVCGIDSTRSPRDAKQQIGFICDRPFLYEKLTGYEFLRFVGGLWGMAKNEIRRQSDEWLERFDLSAWSGEPIEAYSHGMRQRLLFCAALVHQPSLLILDEPMVGLDPLGAMKLKEILRELAKKGMGIILSTHTLDVVEQVCDSVAIIDRGHVLTHGPLEEVLRQHQGQDQRLESFFLKITDPHTREPNTTDERA